jgi:hypothetical protein
MRSRQFTVAFHKEVNVRELSKILAAYYGAENVEVGAGMQTNGLDLGWVVVHNERQRRLDK